MRPAAGTDRAQGDEKGTLIRWGDSKLDRRYRRGIYTLV